MYNTTINFYRISNKREQMTNYLKRLICFGIIALGYPIFIVTGVAILLAQSIHLEITDLLEIRKSRNVTPIQPNKTLLDTLTAVLGIIKTAITHTTPQIARDAIQILLFDTKYLTTEYFTKLSSIAIKGTN